MAKAKLKRINRQAGPAATSPESPPVGIAVIQGSQRTLSLVAGSTVQTAVHRKPNAYVEPQSATTNWFRKYDTQGNVIEEGLYWAEGLPLFRWTYVYNDRGTKMQADLLDANQSLLGRCLYDLNQKLVKKLTYAAGHCNGEIEYEYDDAMNFVGSLVRGLDGSEARLSSFRM